MNTQKQRTGYVLVEEWNGSSELWRLPLHIGSKKSQYLSEDSTSPGWLSSLILCLQPEEPEEFLREP